MQFKKIFFILSSFIFIFINSVHSGGFSDLSNIVSNTVLDYLNSVASSTPSTPSAPAPATPSTPVSSSITVCPNQKVYLTWTSQGATSCSQEIGVPGNSSLIKYTNGATNGQTQAILPKPNQDNGDYSISCSNNTGSTPATTNLVVNAWNICTAGNNYGGALTTDANAPNGVRCRNGANPNNADNINLIDFITGANGCSIFNPFGGISSGGPANGGNNLDLYCEQADSYQILKNGVVVKDWTSIDTSVVNNYRANFSYPMGDGGDFILKCRNGTGSNIWTSGSFTTTKISSNYSGTYPNVTAPTTFPQITISCPAGSSISSAKISGGANLTDLGGGKYEDRTSVLTDAEQQITYEGACTNGKGTAKITITLPPKINASISAAEANKTSEVGENITFNWSANSNTCKIYNNDGTTLRATVTGTAGATTYSGSVYGAIKNYSFSYTFTPANFPELNSSHLNNNTPANPLGYKIICNDSNLPGRRASNIIDLYIQTYIKTKGFIEKIEGDNNLTFTCERDFDKVVITKNGIAVAGYNPKLYNTNQTAKTVVAKMNFSKLSQPSFSSAIIFNISKAFSTFP